MAPSLRTSKRTGLAYALLAAFVLVLFRSFSNFVGGAGSMHRGLRGKTALQAAEEDYPELSRVEGLIYDGCVLKEGEQEIECLRTYNKLTKFHEEAKLGCNIDDLRCVVLDVLDRLCKGIDGQDGLILLNKVAGAMMTFREQFADWDAAFVAADTDKSGELDMDEMTVLLKKANVGMTEKEIALVFMAADANGDGVVSREEFSNFMTAAVFAEEPLRDLMPDKLSNKQPDFEDYLRWTSPSGGSGSWAGIAKLTR